MHRKNGSRGFSLIELLVVSAIILVVAAVATPTIMRSLGTYRLGGSASDVATIVQRTRYEAVKRNTSVTCRGRQVNGLWNVWIDSDNDSNIDANESVILLPRGTNFLAGSNVPSPSSMGYGTVREITGTVTFDARGMVNFGGATPAVLVMYIGNAQQPANGYRAVTLLPNGRTKIWKAVQGGTWYDR
jgi:prepilin-type N-terminal cleavage/methylation domain-containing protein